MIRVLEWYILIVFHSIPWRYSFRLSPKRFSIASVARKNDTIAEKWHFWAKISNFKDPKFQILQIGSYISVWKWSSTISLYHWHTWIIFRIRPYRKKIRVLWINHQCIWYEKVPSVEVNSAMAIAWSTCKVNDLIIHRNFH